MDVPFVDLAREYESLSSQIDEAVSKVLQSGYFIDGDYVDRFESEFSTKVGAKYGVGLNSGSDALTLALQALGIGEGDEVITVSHTFISTVNAIIKNDATPVFVDINPETFVMDTEMVEAAITDATAAILPVHLYGHPVDMDPLLELAEKHDIAIVEDASQAHGATYKGQKVGSIGDIGCFSLYPTKNLGAYGDGGIAVTDDTDIESKIRSLHDYGRSEKYEFEHIENHSRLDELQAAILLKKLSSLNEWNCQRREMANKYTSEISATHADPQSVAPDVEHVFHLYVIQHPKRDQLQQFLESHGISTLIHYPIPVHQQPAYECHISQYDLSVTEKISNEILSLPIHPWLRDEELEATTSGIRDFDSNK
jgi:dTDP-4-amino-4,6-dideoxygalactose transaminase